MNPLVCALMPVNGRPGMVKQAVKCFRTQTYDRAWLLAYDTGEHRCADDLVLDKREIYVLATAPSTLGALRNDALELARASDIIIHWDSDEWFHPRRIEEQVALLQQSGADAVGYNSLLFWREPWPWERNEFTEDGSPMSAWPFSVMPRHPGEAWLYSCKASAPTGTLCYWRSTWEQKPFPEVNEGEGTQWQMGLKMKRIAGICRYDGQPRYVARIHDGNKYRLAYNRDVMEACARQGGEWKRVPEWDQICRETMR